MASTGAGSSLPVILEEVIVGAGAPVGTPPVGAKEYLDTAAQKVTHTVNAAGTAWVVVPSSGGGTEWDLAGTATDALADKTGAIQRTGAVGVGVTPSIPLEVGTGLGAYGLGHTAGTIKQQSWNGTAGVTGGYYGTRSNHPFAVMANDTLVMVVHPVAADGYQYGKAGFAVGGVSPAAALDIGYGTIAPLASTTSRGLRVVGSHSPTTNTTTTYGADVTTTLNVGAAVIGHTGAGIRNTVSATLAGSTGLMYGQHTSLNTTNTGTITTHIGNSTSVVTTNNGAMTTVSGASIAQTLLGTGTVSGVVSGGVFSVSKTTAVVAPTVNGLTVTSTTASTGNTLTTGVNTSVSVSNTAVTAQVAGDKTSITMSGSASTGTYAELNTITIQGTGSTPLVAAVDNTVTTTVGAVTPSVTGSVNRLILNSAVTNAVGYDATFTGTGAVSTSYVLRAGTQVGTNRFGFFLSDPLSTSWVGGRVGVGVGANAPANSIHIGTPIVSGTTGIRTLVTSASTKTAANTYLAADANGDIVLGATVTATTYATAVVNAVTYTLLATDQVITRANTAPLLVTMPSVASLPLGKFFIFVVYSTSVVTFSAPIRVGAATQTVFTGPFRMTIMTDNSGQYLQIA